jgi:hypothetical protein
MPPPQNCAFLYRKKLRQVERPQQEDGHLGACNRAFRAVGERCLTSSAGNPFRIQLLDPRGFPMIGGDILKDARRSRWGLCRAVLGVQIVFSILEQVDQLECRKKQY